MTPGTAANVPSGGVSVRGVGSRAQTSQVSTLPTMKAVRSPMRLMATKTNMTVRINLTQAPRLELSTQRLLLFEDQGNDQRQRFS